MPASNKPLCEDKSCRKIAVAEIFLGNAKDYDIQSGVMTHKPITMCFCAQHTNEFLYGSTKNPRWAYENGYGVENPRIWLLQ